MLSQTVTSALSERFFAGVQSSLNLTVPEIHSFYRLFFIPGMHHCSGGPGAWSIGNVQSYPWDERKLDPAHNALLALVEWVENGTAPAELTGTKYVDDNINGEVEAERSMFDIETNSEGCQVLMEFQGIVCIPQSVYGTVLEIPVMLIVGAALLQALEGPNTILYEYQWKVTHITEI